MSIDATVVGIRKLSTENEVKLTLEPREPGGVAGQSTLAIINTHEMKLTDGWLLTLKKLIGRDVWGGAGEIMLGERKLAKREGYVGIRLVPEWQSVIED